MVWKGARDPYLGLNEHIREQARGQMVPAFTLGRVLDPDPLRVRADGMDLEGEDLLVLYPMDRAWLNAMAAELQIPLLPRDKDDPPPPRWWFLRRGDTVLLGVSEDRQTYYLIGKLVSA